MKADRPARPVVLPAVKCPRSPGVSGCANHVSFPTPVGGEDAPFPA